MYKTHGFGNVRNRKAYDAGLDMIKFDMIQVQNPRVSPTDLDSFMERKGHIVIGEVKHVGTSLNMGQKILRDNMRKYHGAWYFFAQATRDGMQSVELDSDFIGATFRVEDGWYDYELYIVLSCYHQLMYLFANTYEYGSHPRLMGEGRDKMMASALFVNYCKKVCDLYADGISQILPKNSRSLYASSNFGFIQDLFDIMSGNR